MDSAQKKKTKKKALFFWFVLPSSFPTPHPPKLAIALNVTKRRSWETKKVFLAKDMVLPV